MKTLPGTMKTALFGAVVISLSLSVPACGQSPQPNVTPNEPDRDYILKIKKEREFKNGEQAFDNALNSVTPDAIYHFKTKDSSGKESMKDSKTVSLKTDKVITSEVAESASIEELTPIGMHVTTQIASNDFGDIIKIVEQLK